MKSNIYLLTNNILMTSCWQFGCLEQSKFAYMQMDGIFEAQTILIHST